MDLLLTERTWSESKQWSDVEGSAVVQEIGSNKDCGVVVDLRGLCRSRVHVMQKVG